MRRRRPASPCRAFALLCCAKTGTPRPAAPPPGGRITCEDGKRAVSLSSADPGRLHIEFPAAERPALVHLLVGNQQTTREQFIVPHTVTGARVAEVRVNDLPPERLVVALYEVEPGLLGREDMPGLQN